MLSSSQFRLLVLLLLVLVGPAAAQTGQPVTVALTGQTAPSGGTYTGLFAPALNAGGKVAFLATTSAGAGVFAGTPGQTLTAAAVSGGAAPGGGTFTTAFNSPVLNTAGDVAFLANTTSPAARGVFAGTPGQTLTDVARTGGQSPDGGNYLGLNQTNLPFGGGGQVAYRASTTFFSDAVFVGTPGQTPTAAGLFQGAAPIPGGAAYSRFGSTVSVNPGGQVAFEAAYTNFSNNNSGVFVGTPGQTLTAAAYTGQAAPGGGTFSFNFSAPVLNAAGQVAFRANTSAGVGVFAGTPGQTLTAAAVSGGAAPGGGTFTTAFTAPVLGGSGQVAFVAGTSNGSGVFVGTPGQTLTAAAVSGGAAPGGDTFNTFPLGVSHNAVGQVAFVATLTGAAVTTANDSGLYLYSPGGLVKVVREGDVMNVNPTGVPDFRIVADGGISVFLGSGGEDGRGDGLNDLGQLTYSLTFTDATQGIFVVLIAPVPEPAAVGLAAVGGLGTARWARRRLSRG